MNVEMDDILLPDFVKKELSDNLKEIKPQTDDMFVLRTNPQLMEREEALKQINEAYRNGYLDGYYDASEGNANKVIFEKEEEE